MIHKMTSPTPLHMRVVFELPACIWADQIYLVGDFNNWNETATPFHQMRNGVWCVALDLPTNHRFEFRYHVGEQWYTDYHADGIASSPYHTLNSVVDTTLPLKMLHVSRHLHAHPDRRGSIAKERQPSKHEDLASEEAAAMSGW